MKLYEVQIKRYENAKWETFAEFNNVYEMGACYNKMFYGEKWVAIRVLCDGWNITAELDKRTGWDGENICHD